MKKIVFFFLLFVLLAFPVFSDDIDVVDDTAAEVEIQKSELNNKNYDRAMGIINDLEKSGEVANMVADIIDNLMLRFINIHNETFGTERVSDPLDQPSFSLSGRFNFGAGTVFKFLLSLFIIIYVLVFAIHTVTKPNVQYSELLDTAWRIVVCFFIFAIMPYIPTMLVNLAFSFAQTVTGSLSWEYGATEMTYSAPIHMTRISGILLLSSGGAAAISSLFEFSVGFIANIGVDLGGLSWISMAIFGIFMGGLLTSFVVAIQFAIRCLDLYITNFLMAVVLPGAILKGWGNEQFLGYDTITLIKYYILNTFEIFIGATMILIVNGVFNALTREMINGGSWGTGFLENQRVRGAGLIRMGIQYLAQPLLLSILMPVSSDILRNLTGAITGVSDANASVSGATSQSFSAIKSSATAYGLREVLRNRKTADVSQKASAASAATSSNISQQVSNISQGLGFSNLRGGGNGGGAPSGNS